MVFGSLKASTCVPHIRYLLLLSFNTFYKYIRLIPPSNFTGSKTQVAKTAKVWQSNSYGSVTVRGKSLV